MLPTSLCASRWPLECELLMRATAGLAKTTAEKEARKMAAEAGIEYVAINPGLVLGECMIKKHTKVCDGGRGNTCARTRVTRHGW